MLATFKSCARLLGAAGSGLALAGLAVLPAQAAEATAPAAPVNEVNSQIVVRDAATGQLRAPTAEEARALTTKTDGLRRAPAATLSKVHPSGARGARLTDDFMTYTVVVRQPDGSLVEQCFDSRAAADAAAKAGSVAKSRILPTE